MRIILVGQGPFGEKVLEAFIKKGEEIVGVFSPPDKRGEPMKNLAEKSKVLLPPSPDEGSRGPSHFQRAETRSCHPGFCNRYHS
jgi:hypothetical protein